MNAFKKLLLLAAFTLSLASSKLAHAQSAWDCLVSFDDPWALANLGVGARNGFAGAVKYDQYGKIVYCGANDTWENCWGYRERCGYSQFYVNYYPWGTGNHHHYSYENKTIGVGLCTCNPGDKYGAGQGFRDPVTNVCDKVNCPNWPYERRESFTVGHHDSSWTYLYVDRSGDSQRHVFWMYDIIVGGTLPIQLWYVKTDGTTWGWDRIDPGYRYLDIRDATSVWIGPAVGATSTPSIVDFIIWPQY